MGQMHGVKMNWPGKGGEFFRLKFIAGFPRHAHARVACGKFFENGGQSQFYTFRFKRFNWPLKSCNELAACHKRKDSALAPASERGV
jgi:hypothetical protein